MNFVLRSQAALAIWQDTIGFDFFKSNSQCTNTPELRTGGQ